MELLHIMYWKRCARLRDAVTKHPLKLHKAYRNNFYITYNTISVVVSSEDQIGWTRGAHREHGACPEQYGWKTSKERTADIPGVDGRRMLKWILEKQW